MHTKDFVFDLFNGRKKEQVMNLNIVWFTFILQDNILYLRPLSDIAIIVKWLFIEGGVFRLKFNFCLYKTNCCEQFIKKINYFLIIINY